MDGFADLHKLPEDDQIDMIGRYVTHGKKVAGVFVDDEPGKPERYIKKLKEKFPGIEILKVIKKTGIKGTVLIQVGPAQGGTTQPSRN